MLIITIRPDWTPPPRSVLTGDSDTVDLPSRLSEVLGVVRIDPELEDARDEREPTCDSDASSSITIERISAARSSAGDSDPSLNIC